jgi:hypothetical protein
MRQQHCLHGKILEVDILNAMHATQCLMRFMLFKEASICGQRVQASKLRHPLDSQVGLAGLNEMHAIQSMLHSTHFNSASICGQQWAPQSKKPV